MKTAIQLILAFKKGYLDEVAKEVERYGCPTEDTRWEDSLGNWRVKVVWHHALRWEIHWLNGEIKEMGWRPGKDGR